MKSARSAKVHKYGTESSNVQNNTPNNIASVSERLPFGNRLFWIILPMLSCNATRPKRYARSNNTSVISEKVTLK